MITKIIVSAKEVVPEATPKTIEDLIVITAILKEIGTCRSGEIYY